MEIKPELKRHMLTLFEDGPMDLPDLANHLGVSLSTIYRWKSGENRTIQHRYWVKLKPLLEKHVKEFTSGTVGHLPKVIKNTPELNDLIVDKVYDSGMELRSVCRLAGYDSPDTLRRLLKGELDYFPSMLSGLSAALKIPFETLPISDAERELLSPGFEHGWQTRDIPVMSMAQAAEYSDIPGVLNDPKTWREFEEYTAVPADGRKYSAFRVDGNSMSPTLLDGDIALCDLDKEVSNNKVVVCKFGDQVVLKRYHRDGNRVWLRSDNDEFGENYDLDASEIEWILAVTDLKRKL